MDLLTEDNELSTAFVNVMTVDVKVEVRLWIGSVQLVIVPTIKYRSLKSKIDRFFMHSGVGSKKASVR